MNYFKNISTFYIDVAQNGITTIFTATYDNLIDVIYYNIKSKKFEYKPTNSFKIYCESSINSMEYYDKTLFFALRNGEFAISSFINGHLNHELSYKISDDPSISIQSIKVSNYDFSIILVGEDDCFNLSVNKSLDKIIKFKLVINEKSK